MNITCEIIFCFNLVLTLKGGFKVINTDFFGLFRLIIEQSTVH